MMRIRLWATAVALAVLAGCASKPTPPPEPELQPVLPVAPPAPPPPPAPPVQDWHDLALTPGEWLYREEGSGSLARFGAPQSEGRFIVRCDRGARQVTLRVEGVTTQMVIRASSAARTLPASARPEPLPYSTASLAASDELLDAMVFSRGRFTVEAPGLERLVVPVWPEPARVIEDCRG
jgi:hypothetical protein